MGPEDLYTPGEWADNFGYPSISRRLLSSVADYMAATQGAEAEMAMISSEERKLRELYGEGLTDREHEDIYSAAREDAQARVAVGEEFDESLVESYKAFAGAERDSKLAPSSFANKTFEDSEDLYSARWLDRQTGAIELNSGQAISRVHAPNSCWGDVCPIHSPSDHSMREWPLYFANGHFVRIVPGVKVSSTVGIMTKDLEGYSLVVIDPDDYRWLDSGEAVVRLSGVCLSCGEDMLGPGKCSCGEALLSPSGSKNVTDTSIVFLREEID